MQVENSFYSQVDSSRCFLRALAKAPTSFMGLAVAHLLHFRNSRNLLVSTSMYSLESFTPQLKDPAVVPSASRCTTCVLLCLKQTLHLKSQNQTGPVGISGQKFPFGLLKIEI